MKVNQALIDELREKFSAGKAPPEAHWHQLIFAIAFAAEDHTHRAGGGPGSGTGDAAPLSLLDLADTPGSFQGHGGKALFVKSDESGVSFEPLSAAPTTFDALLDTPSSKAGHAGKGVRVNSAESALEYVPLLELGETAATAYRGDRGKIAYDHSQNESGAVHGATSAPTAGALVRRDAHGRAQVAAPSDSADIARKMDVDAMIPRSIGQAKGDLIAFTASSTPTRVPVGTNGQVLVADSAQAAGVRWGSAAGSLPILTLYASDSFLQFTSTVWTSPGPRFRGTINGQGGSFVLEAGVWAWRPGGVRIVNVANGQVIGTVETAVTGEQFITSSPFTLPSGNITLGIEGRCATEGQQFHVHTIRVRPA